MNTASIRAQVRAEQADKATHAIETLAQGVALVQRLDVERTILLNALQQILRVEEDCHGDMPVAFRPAVDVARAALSCVLVPTRYRIQVRTTGFLLGYQLAHDEAAALAAWKRKGSLGLSIEEMVGVPC